MGVTVYCLTPGQTLTTFILTIQIGMSLYNTYTLTFTFSEMFRILQKSNQTKTAKVADLQNYKLTPWPWCWEPWNWFSGSVVFLEKLLCAANYGIEQD